MFAMLIASVFGFFSQPPQANVSNTSSQPAPFGGVVKIRPSQDHLEYFNKVQQKYKEVDAKRVEEAKAPSVQRVQRCVPVCVEEWVGGLIKRKRYRIEYRMVEEMVATAKAKKKVQFLTKDSSGKMHVELKDVEADEKLVGISWYDPKVSFTLAGDGTYKFTNLPPTTGARLDFIRSQLDQAVQVDKQLPQVIDSSVELETNWLKSSTGATERQVRYTITIVSPDADAITIEVRVKERTLPFTGSYTEYNKLPPSESQNELVKLVSALRLKP